ncbi:hypothetical protein AKJ57_01940 [candidate division MSBL1 archaeon SCGC-AAA259A05]|uniref:Bacterial type II secretion system protein E domain-containing protein n=1 Tax=candidate division MSBL1 archaeon SCGC-AAA259A05 TaxID=1698259 RepID=A0A133UAN1_9EURY|nr:hypothetical protein AKJ57_01940 [candidate division MSBL1 archaeon SCGC-AAA259A05]
MGEGESIPLRSSISTGASEETTEIPEISTRAVGEPEIEEVLESTEHAEIYRTKRGSQPYYKVDLPELSSEEREIMREVREQAIEEIEIDPRNVADVEEREELFYQGVKERLEDEELPREVSDAKLDQMVKIIVRDMIGFGLLDILLEDDDLEDILVTATGKPVYVYHRRHGMCVTNIRFENEDELLHQIEKMGRRVGRRIDQQNPLLDATLPDGSRVNATIPPASLDGPTLSIRKFRRNPLTIVDIINYDTLSIDVAAFLWLAVEGLGIKPSNIIFAGGTACGKTTTMNAFSAFVPDRERIISIEDTAELNLPHKHWVRLETRPPNVEGRGEITMDDLVKNALRMRPDRIVVGEVRGPEAMTMFTGMNTGHDGCMGTIHSNSARETVTRLTEKPMDVPEVMIPALDAVVMQQRIHHRKMGQIRRITEIAEVMGFENGKPQLSRIYKWNAKKDALGSTGVPSTIKKTIADFAGMEGSEIEREIKRRAVVLEWLREKEIRDVYKVGEVVQEYYRDPDAFFENIELEGLREE